MSRSKIILVLLFTFLFGAVAGAVLTGAAIRRQTRHFLAEGPKATQDAILRGVSRRLALTAEQKEKARPAVAAAQRRLMTIRRHVQPDVEAVLEDTIRDLRPLLDARQMRRLDEMHTWLKTRWALPADSGKIEGESKKP